MSKKRVHLITLEPAWTDFTQDCCNRVQGYCKKEKNRRIELNSTGTESRGVLVRQGQLTEKNQRVLGIVEVRQCDQAICVSQGTYLKLGSSSPMEMETQGPFLF